MTMGRPLRPLDISDESRTQLESISRSRSMPHMLVRRAKIVLMSEQGLSNQQIGEQIGLSGASVGKEVLSNVVDGKRAHPAISGCLFHFTVDEWHPLDDLGDELVAPESVPVFLRIGGQFEYHGESGYT